MAPLRIASVLALVAAASSCEGRPAVHPMAIDDGFSSEEITLLQTAASKWEAVAPGRILLVPGPCPSRESCVLKEAAPSGRMAVTYVTDDVVAIDPHLSGQVFLHVALHEFGHVLGLEKTVDGVMNCAGVDYPTELAAADLLECQRAGACPAR